MVNAIQQIVRLTDSALARVYLSLFQERSALITFLFHSLFRNEQDSCSARGSCTIASLPRRR